MIILILQVKLIIVKIIFPILWQSDNVWLILHFSCQGWRKEQLTLFSSHRMFTADSFARTFINTLMLGFNMPTWCVWFSSFSWQYSLCTDLFKLKESFFLYTCVYVCNYLSTAQRRAQGITLLPTGLGGQLLDFLYHLISLNNNWKALAALDLLPPFPLPC